MNRDYVRFMILSDARTGSNMLVEGLNSDPRIVCFREIFNFSDDFVDFNVAGFRSRSDDDALRRSDPQQFLQSRVFVDHGDRVRAVGFKFHYGHVWGYERIDDVFAADVDLRVIHLTRRNMLRSLVSQRIAQRTGTWFEYPPEPSLASRLKVDTLLKAARDPQRAAAAIGRKLRTRQSRRSPAVSATPVTRLVITEEECRQHFVRTQHNDAYWNDRLARHQLIRVTYEELASQRDERFGRIQSFLGLDPRPPVVSLRRQNPQPLHQLITNYEELRTAFAATEYAPFFED